MSIIPISAIQARSLSALVERLLPEDAAGRQGLIALERDFATGATAPVEVVVDSRGAPELDEQVAGLQARLERDSDFAAEGAMIEEGRGLVIVSVPLNVEARSEEYVPEAFGDAADRVLVGGLPAENRDFFALIGRWLPVVIAFVLALSLVLLTLAFRSIVVSLTGKAVNLLSVGAAYGLLVLVFQEGVGSDLFGFGQVDRIEAWLPVFLFSLLSVCRWTTQVFLLSRIRERYTSTGDTTGPSCSASDRPPD
jgi:RND superfamily putative drug exporter